MYSSSYSLDIRFAVFRLTTSFDEVSVYPIPAILYMVKNLLQVCPFDQSFVDNNNAILLPFLVAENNNKHKTNFTMLLLLPVAVSIISLHMWMRQLTRS